MKKIILTTRQVESLKELIDRGLAYTDMFYRHSKRMENIYKTVNQQLKTVNNMITEDYVSFETAKLLKEKGFDEPCYQYYITTKTLHTTFHNRRHVEDEPFFNSYNLDGLCDISDRTLFDDVCSAPTLQMAMKWLREVHNLFITLAAGENDSIFWYDFDVVPINGRNIEWDWYENIPTEEHSSPEEACEAAIKYCLENLI